MEINQFKPLCVLLGACVMLMVAVPPAVATDYFQSDEYPAEITGSATEAQAFAAEGLSIQCTVASFGGSLPEPLEKIEVSASYSGCTSLGIAATVSMEGCKWALYANATTVDIVCPSEKAIEIVAAGGACEVLVGAQTGVSKAEYSASGSEPENLSVNFNLSGVKYVKTKDVFPCLLMGTGEGNNGTLSGTDLFKGWKNEAEVGFQRKPGKPTKLCKEDKNPCPAMQEHKMDTLLKGSSENVEFVLAGDDVISCGPAEISGKTKADVGNPLLQTTWNNAVFGTCLWTGTKGGKGTGCTVGLSPSATVDILRIGGKNGDWRLGTSQLVLACNRDGYRSCVYKGEGAKLELRGGKEGNAAAVVDRLFGFISSGEELPFCFKQATWKGTYEMSSPQEFYVTN